MTASLDNLSRINQRREVETDYVHLKFDLIAVLNHGSNDSVLNLSVVQVDADFVANLELSIIGLSWGWHAGECTTKFFPVRASGGLQTRSHCLRFAKSVSEKYVR